MSLISSSDFSMHSNVQESVPVERWCHVESAAHLGT